MSRVVNAVKESLGMWRIVLLVYIFQLILVSTVGLQMMQVLDASIGNSLSLDKLTDGFDYTVFTDFVNVHGGSFVVLYGQMRWMVLIYMIFASFISTGIIYCLVHGLAQISDFFRGAVKYFIRLFFVDVIFTFVIIVIIGVSLSLVGMLFGIAPTSFDTELVFLRWTLLIVLVALFLIIVLTLWRLKIKFYLIKTDQGLITSLSNGFKSLWRNKWSNIFYSLLFLIVTIILVLMNYAIGDLPLFPMIVLVQLIALIKIFWRVAFYRVIGG